MESRKEQSIEKLLASCQITLNGSDPWDITVKNPAFYDRVLTQGSLGLGESYMEGWWDCPELDQFFYRLFTNKIWDKAKASWPVLWEGAKAKLFNLQSRDRAFQVGQRHYDLGNEFFAKMLGPSMAYSCGYWSRPQSGSRPGSGKDIMNLDEAQFAKYDLICRKLNLSASGRSPEGRQVRILDIGCGWGGLAKYMAEKYGVSVVGVTVSKEQAAYATEVCRGLPVEFKVQDYRDFNEKFDHIVSVGMFEHVGVKNYKTYFEVAKRCLKKDGLFLLHTIGNAAAGYPPDPWIDKYIFPNSLLPSLQEIAKFSEKLFITEDVHNFGAHYDTTLQAWSENFKKGWPQFEKQYGWEFYRMWEFYLMSCAAMFRARGIELWQIVLSPTGVKGGYNSVR